MHTPNKTPLKEWSARRGDHYRHKTQETQQTNIYALNGIRGRDPSQQDAADIRLRRQSPRDQQRQNWQTNKYIEQVGLFGKSVDLYSKTYMFESRRGYGLLLSRFPVQPLVSYMQILKS